MRNGLDGCQIPGLPRMGEEKAPAAPQPFVRRLKRSWAVPWNHYVKMWLKRAYYVWTKYSRDTDVPIVAKDFAPATPFVAGDWIRVRSKEEIKSTLDPFKELKGCAFLENMYQYCGTRQRVLKVMQRFLDERDYKVKKVHGIILLENVICDGTPAFGPCDRCCYLFWREEWLHKAEN